MKELIFYAIIAVVIAIGTEAASAQTYCNDGSYSGSHGSGTCSHHGGEWGNHRRGYVSRTDGTFILVGTMCHRDSNGNTYCCHSDGFGCN